MIASFRRAVWRRQRGARQGRIPGDWRAVLKRRVLIAALLAGCWVAGIEARLIYLQVHQRADLEARAARQHFRTRPVPAKRGDILDRNGRLLATSVDADTIVADPSEIGDEVAAVADLCQALGDCSPRERRALVERLGQAREFAYIRRRVAPDAAARVAAIGMKGIGFIKESRRWYPNKELAAHLLGYVGIDNVGLEGLESAYDSQIRGKDGKVLVHTDGRRHAFNRIERPPTSGATIELTIDQYLQHVAERELHSAVLRNRAAGGSVVAMDPRTGEILAMANDPAFNPNVYGSFPGVSRRNRAVQDLYEPGSTFKVVTASAAIEEKVMPIETWIDTSPGVIRVGDSAIDEYRGHNYGVLSFTDVIVKSSNVGAVKIGLRVGTERLSKYVSLFGFGRPVSPDFPGESPGIVWSPDKWTERALASVAMGYQVAVTPLQMVAAVSAVANSGEVVEPRVVRAVYRGGARYAIKPRVLRRAISADTAAALTTIMEEVVERGTATLAQIPGYRIAGKTGTASKLVGGRYSASENNVSFVGFLPSRNPVVAIIVVIDAPHAGANSGGFVSAPVFKRIGEAALRHFGVQASIGAPPPVLVARGSDESTVGSSSIGAELSVVSLTAKSPSGTVPDLRGMTARQASRELVKLGLLPHLSGNGVVVSQHPPPGTRIEESTVGRLLLAREPVRLAASDTP